MMITTFRKRLRITPSESSVTSSLPILFFGDAFHAHVATIGLNPSKSEYLDRKDILLTGNEQRFATTLSLGVSSREELSDFQADHAIEIMRSYYDEGKPVYGSYFRHLKNFLTGMGMSYNVRSATHLDLVQEPTNPVWNLLKPFEREALLKRDMSFLLWQLNVLSNLKVVICAGKTVSEQLCTHVKVEIKKTGSMNRFKWWLGTAYLTDRKLPIGGWNYPLDRPTGLNKVGEIDLGKTFAKELL
jgi:hypothetical protein